MGDFAEAEVFNRVKDDVEAPVFKKPIVIGKRPGVSKNISMKNVTAEHETEKNQSTDGFRLPDVKENSSKESILIEPNKKLEKTIEIRSVSSPVTIDINYKEPEWSGLCGNKKFSLEILKNGTIVQCEDLGCRPYFVIGRLPVCNIVLEHPSISRFHAVLQYKTESDATNAETGWYLYDLGSTHGTWLNKRQIPPKVYSRVRVGHVFKFGVSTRLFVLQGPEEDQEAESELTVTELIELKKKRESCVNVIEDQDTFNSSVGLAKIPGDLRLQSSSSDGIDWGMGEDAQEDENPLAENPFAVIDEDHEELCLDDPKKTLKGWFEREGYELEYKVEEKSYAHFVCRVDLPIDSATGKSLVAEATVKGGKKKEAVVQCALEACRILDRHGLLRKSTHERKYVKKRKAYDEDYYSSDEDVFLDRTGTAERKRRTRTKAKYADSAETYDSLMLKYQDLEKEIVSIRESIAASSVSSGANKTKMETDDLDTYISALQAEEACPKKSAAAMRAKLHQLEKEKVKVGALIKVARPTLAPILSTLPDRTEVSLSASVEASSSKQPPLLASVPKNEVPNKASTQETSKLTSPLKTSETEQGSGPTMQLKTTHSKSVSLGTNRSPNVHVDTAKPSVEESASGGKETTEAHLKTEIIGINESSRTPGLVLRKRKKTTASPAAAIPQVKLDQSAQSYDSMYDMWTPPEDQSGDGKNSLNRKLGY